jgi:hypothetical protein
LDGDCDGVSLAGDKVEYGPAEQAVKIAKADAQKKTVTLTGIEVSFPKSARSTGT